MFRRAVGFFNKKIVPSVRLYRMDTHGTTFDLGCMTEQEAVTAIEKLTEHTHRQTYWYEPSQHLEVDNKRILDRNGSEIKFLCP